MMHQRTAFHAVVSFNGEEEAVSQYAAALKSPTRTSIRLAVYNGMALGFVFFMVFVSYSIALTCAPTCDFVVAGTCVTL